MIKNRKILRNQQLLKPSDIAKIFRRGDWVKTAEGRMAEVVTLFSNRKVGIRFFDGPVTEKTPTNGAHSRNISIRHTCVANAIHQSRCRVNAASRAIKRIRTGVDKLHKARWKTFSTGLFFVPVSFPVNRAYDSPNPLRDSYQRGDDFGRNLAKPT